MLNLLPWLKRLWYFPGREPKLQKRQPVQKLYAIPVIDIQNPANWPILLKQKNLAPIVREKIQQMQILAAQGEWHPNPPGKRWSDPY